MAYGKNPIISIKPVSLCFLSRFTAFADLFFQKIFTECLQDSDIVLHPKVEQRMRQEAIPLGIHTQTTIYPEI